MVHCDIVPSVEALLCLFIVKIIFWHTNCDTNFKCLKMRTTISINISERFIVTKNNPYDNRDLKNSGGFSISSIKLCFTARRIYFKHRSDENSDTKY